MLRTVFNRLENDLVTKTSLNMLDSVLGQTFVRYQRKPRWLPTAKSKVFRVPKRPVIPIEEDKELQRLHNIYKTDIKSIRKFFHDKTMQSLTGVDVVAEQKRIEEEEHLKCLQINEEWNKNVAKLREETLAKEKEETMLKIMQTVQENRLKYEEIKQKADQFVREEKERSKSYITAENIDEAIQKALEIEVDYNYAIDLNCNIYHGRRGKPDPNTPKNTVVEEEKEIAASA